ncbi:GMC oxidoreductase [Zopfia rhizophila CBS 207.26]|uniref:GMC oxidoreductase n=1 Tax=Zopfia rhizophila CBS 207.26 TaxID=1314779 RepID=A0A6A6EDH3_9PEZI|nr:GMC oxidoreductase [Zopfia rhizophila CBS 207.26]
MLSRVLLLFGFALSAAAASAATMYEYIIVGSGSGGGPLAANLARAGHSVLLLEAGDDQGDNVNMSMILNFNLAGNDPTTRWDFFYEHMTWRTKDGGFYVGTSPPAGAKQLGIYYPRAGTLGGCAMHNAGVSALPQDSDWNYIARITGDDSWKAENMRKHLIKLENAEYAPGSNDHGHSGYLTITQTPVVLANGSDDRTFVQIMADATGAGRVSLDQLVTRDMNANDPNRDTSTGIFGTLRHSDSQGRRTGTNTYIRATVRDPAKYPLTIQLYSLVTKILFSNSSTTPTALGVEYLQGPSLYSADPRYNASAKGKVGQAIASREVIIAGGVFNSPQILKLSGIGPAEELKKFSIPVVVDLPGVGTRMADNYETSIIRLGSRDLHNVGGPYAVMLKSSVANNTRDLYLFCGALSFEGYWPGFPKDYGHSEYECAIVHIGPHSQAGTVLLRSSDPRDMPEINSHFFDKNADTDLTAILDGVKWARNAFDRVPKGLGPWKEVHPCPSPNTNCTDVEQKEFIRLQAYSHHATSTCQIGGDNDKMAVLDSKFRVRGVKNLRVVDGSAFPKVPGAFPVLPTFMLSEKATESILADIK